MLRRRSARSCHDTSLSIFPGEFGQGSPHLLDQRLPVFAEIVGGATKCVFDPEPEVERFLTDGESTFLRQQRHSRQVARKRIEGRNGLVSYIVKLMIPPRAEGAHRSCVSRRARRR